MPSMPITEPPGSTGSYWAGGQANPALKLAVAQINNVQMGRMSTYRRQMVEARQAHLTALALIKKEGALDVRLPDVCVSSWLAPVTFLAPKNVHSPPLIRAKAIDPLQSPGSNVSVWLGGELLRGLPTALPPIRNTIICLPSATLRARRSVEARGHQAKGGAEAPSRFSRGWSKPFRAFPTMPMDLSEAFARIHIPRPPIPAEAQRVIGSRFGKALVCWRSCSPGIPIFLIFLPPKHASMTSWERSTGKWTAGRRRSRAVAQSRHHPGHTSETIPRNTELWPLDGHVPHRAGRCLASAKPACRGTNGNSRGHFECSYTRWPKDRKCARPMTSLRSDIPGWRLPCVKRGREIAPRKLHAKRNRSEMLFALQRLPLRAILILWLCAKETIDYIRASRTCSPAREIRTSSSEGPPLKAASTHTGL